MPNILASAISNIPHFAAFDQLAEERMSTIQLDKLLIYIIDTVDASALPWLAKQFNVLGYRGMRLAQTEAQQRQVIKTAILLKRYAGTPWAVKQALISIGYPDAILIENAGVGPYGWAQFRIELNVGDNSISADKLEELIQMINIYKGARNHLLDISYTISFTEDGLNITDESNENPSIDDDDAIYVGGNFRYDGQGHYDGDHNYSSDSDVLEIEIINI
jgi:phage tail P2-like protein